MGCVFKFRVTYTNGRACVHVYVYMCMCTCRHMHRCIWKSYIKHTQTGAYVGKGGWK